MTRSQTNAAKRRYTLGVFIGRMSPPHLGHGHVIKEGLTVADEMLINLGSAYAARSYHYIPFTAPEREQMIRLMLTAEENQRVHFSYVEDQGNMQKWTSTVRKFANAIEPDNKNITLVGHSKDRSSFYLKSFKGWAATDVSNYGNLSATTFREIFFHPAFMTEETNHGELINIWEDGLHPDVRAWLREFANQNAYQEMIAERLKVASDKKKYGEGPFLTGDAIVIQGDHVLMIERGNYPFKGCLAFPGGFVESDERVEDAIFRELTEETGLKVPELVLRRSLIRVDYWDAPWRDPRGRVVTWAGLIHLNPIPPANMIDPKEIEKYLELPRVKGADDAKRAFFIPIADVKRENTAFDHYTILQHVLDHLPKD